MLANPQPYFAKLNDPCRQTRNKLHALQDIIMITLCATRFDDWVSIEDFAKENGQWLRQFLPLSNRVPSYDTLSDVIGRIESHAFAAAFARWMHDSRPELGPQHIALDRKTLRGSRQDGNTIHLMSTFATRARLVLAQRQGPDKANEISALPELIKVIDLRGAIITIDAISCQKQVAEQLNQVKADYVLALKNNHPALYENVALWLDTQLEQGRLPVQETIEKGHGRVEVRRYALSQNTDWLPDKEHWKGLAAVGRVESIRHVGNKKSWGYRYFLSSVTDADLFALVVRDQ